ncbi:MAG: ATP-binding protein [Thermodesulfobacteriota bacterium]
MSLHPVLFEKLNSSLVSPPVSALTWRDAQLPRVPGKVHAVIGMRRAGKTTFLRQLLAERRRNGPVECAVYIGFDDDRLADLAADQLNFLLEEYYRRFPDLRGSQTVHWFLDEIQLVSGWDRFVRRVLDTERVEVVVSGSSARMLSREVHTSLRGRGMETVIRPFSFREFLRHRGEEPEEESSRWTSATRSLVEKRFGEFLVEGGFPETQGMAPALRVELLQGYVDTVLFRDVVERYGVSQVTALRWIIRHCLRNPAGGLSMHRIWNDLKSQGLGVAKDAVHAMFGFLQDAFLVSAVPLATDSERRRNTNPRKIYPIDPGMISAFALTGRPNIGHALKTVVQNELERRRARVGYVKTGSGWEVDFLVRYPAGGEELVQVCADPGGAETTMEREVRALHEAAVEYPSATRRLLVLNQDQILSQGAAKVIVQPAYEWMLTTDENI